MFFANHTSVNKLLLIFLAMMPMLDAAPVSAASIEPDFLTIPTAMARDRLIARGIEAYKAGYHAEAVYLLRNFLNRHKIITTPLEKTGIAYLAQAYLAVGSEIQAQETITRAIAVGNYQPAELANLEYIAGKIALQQNQLAIANQHWETARRLYLVSRDYYRWQQITLELIKNYETLGKLSQVRQLSKEWTNANY